MKPGDYVIVRAWYCEVDGMGGTVLYLDPACGVMVMLDNSREWPFEPHELELVTR